MKILHITTEAQLRGAGISAYRVHKGLGASGVDSMILASKVRQQEDCIITPSSTFEKIAARLYPVLDRIPGRLSRLRRVAAAGTWLAGWSAWGGKCRKSGSIRGIGRWRGGPLIANYRWTWTKRTFILPILSRF